MKSRLKFARPLALAAAVAAILGACDEQLDGGAACPALCPRTPATVKDTTFFAVDMDSAVAGFPTIGTELRLFIASFGDTLQTRAVVRYDSLPITFRHNNSAIDTNIVFIDTGAVLKLTIVTGDTLGAPTTVEAYDVDLGGADDDDPTAVKTAFTPGRLLGSRTIPADSMKDTIRVPIDPDKLLAKIQATAPGNRLRIGIRVSDPGGGSASMTMLSTNNGTPPLIIFRPSADTSVALDTVIPRSTTPAEPFISSDLRDYLVVALAPPDPPPGVIRVGGMPARRAYFHFNIPSNIIDSSNIVRATLQLTQRPNGFSPNPNDTVALQPYALTAGPVITDLRKALLFLLAPSGTDTVRLVAADSGVRDIEMIRIMKLWSATSATKTPRALVLRSTVEGASGKQIDFYSIESPVDVRPRLRLSYLPRPVGGLP